MLSNSYVNSVKSGGVKSKKKLCNCGVNYIDNYYIVYIILFNSNGNIPHCVGNGWERFDEKMDILDYRYLISVLSIVPE